MYSINLLPFVCRQVSHLILFRTGVWRVLLVLLILWLLLLPSLHLPSLAIF